MTLRQFAEQVFLPSKQVNCSGNTLSSFQGNLNNYIYPRLGSLKLPEITSGHINALLLEVQASGKAHGTVVKVYTVLKSLFKLAYMNDTIDRNPMDKVERILGKDEVSSSNLDSSSQNGSEVVRFRNFFFCFAR